MIDNWHAVDLHMHTCVGVTGDGKSDVIKNFTYENYLKSLKECDIELAAITNHNHIDLTNYIICRYLAKKIGINILFGVEIDTETEKTKRNYHFVAVFDESLNNCIQITDFIENKTNEKKLDGKVRYNSSEIVELIKYYNVVIIPHGNKSKGLLENATEDEIKEALKKVKEGFIRVFDTRPSEWKLERIKNLIDEGIYPSIDDDFGGVLFSDNRDWSNYKNIFHNFYMNAEPTFKVFLHSITNPTERFSIKELIPAAKPYISKITIRGTNENSKIQNCDIDLKSGYNCIIGKSGSGKSLLHYLIKTRLINNELIEENYGFAKDCEIHFYDKSGNEIEKGSINIAIGEKIFDKIITASETKNDTDMYKVIKVLKKDFIECRKYNSYTSKYKKLLADYYDFNDENKKTSDFLKSEFNDVVAKIEQLNSLHDISSFEIKTPEDNAPEYDESSLKNLNIIYSNISEIRSKILYFKEPIKSQLSILLKTFEDEYLKQLKNIHIKNLNIQYSNKKKSIVRKAIKDVNKDISTNATKKSDLNNSLPNGLNKLAKDLVKNYINCKAYSLFDFSISVDEMNLEEELISGQGIVFTEKVDATAIKFLDIKSNSLFNSRKITKKLTNSILDMSRKDEAKLAIDTYLNCGIAKDALEKTFDNLKPSVEVYFDGQSVKQLNPGNIAKKYIEVYFENELANDKNAVILYDQIENDVDKEFICSTIVKLISEMKKKVQIIIVTHDPIVAVNADPVNYVEAQKDDKGFIKYRSFAPESTKRDELMTIARNVDGSKKVIKERYEIYRGDRNYED